MMPTPSYWRGRRVLVTGHTGFKGSWLTCWLQAMGAEVSALSLLPETQPNLHDLLAFTLRHERIADLRDPAAVADLMERCQPEIVLHLAARALVRPSYDDPLGTFATNVMGTAHVLEGARRCPATRVVLVVTSDKVYENPEDGRPFTENDRLGGHDPYSASKACTEILTAAYRRSFFGNGQGARIATARAGNVIGGGDWSANRLIPDLIRIGASGETLRLRYPNAVRPWQHVLDALAGYLMFAEALDTRPAEMPDALNFAPDPASFKTVAELVDSFGSVYGPAQWEAEAGTTRHEASLLTLSAEQAKRTLGWQPLLGFAETVEWTASWYRANSQGRDMRSFTRDQVAVFMDRLAETSR